METNGNPLHQPLSARTVRSRFWLGAAVIGLVLSLPVFLAVVVFPSFQQEPFESLDELQPESLRSLQVRILVRPEIDQSLANRPDIGPYYADGADYRTLLEPLREAREVSSFPDAQGPLLGEYRIITAENRRGTIRLYWDRDTSAGPEVAARLRFKIGTRKYEGGTAMAVIQAAEDAASRARQGR